jgi:hypothetical protein
MRTSRSLVIVSSLFLIAGCSSVTGNVVERAIEKETRGNADVDMDANGAMHVETEDGSFDMGGNTLPADWPTDAPIYAGATIQYAASVNPTTGNPGSAAVLMTTDAPADVAAQYKDALEDAGWTITANGNAMGMMTMAAAKDDRTLSALIAGQAGQTSITIAIEREAE